MAKLLGQREYARHRGVALSAVQKAMMSGRLDRAVQTLPGGARKIDPTIADLEWEANTDPSQRRSKAPAETAADQPLLFDGADAPPSGTSVGADDKARNIHDVKRMQALLKVALMRLDLEQRSKSMCDVAGYQSEALQSGSVVRQAVMAVPAQVRDQLAATKDPHRVQQLLEAALERALAAVATHYKSRVGRRSKVA